MQARRSNPDRDDRRELLRTHVRVFSTSTQMPDKISWPISPCISGGGSDDS